MTVLDRICADKRVHVAAMKAALPLAQLMERVAEQPPTRGFIDALRNKTDTPALIAEVKKASPSRGVIREDFDPVDIARIYRESGAACLSVLTDAPYFQGEDAYLTDIRRAVDVPLLRKDFMVDPYQIYESRYLGADCVLLIMAALTDDQAAEMYEIATSLSLDTLFEVHDENELARALALKPKMIGVNNRNLKTLDVDLATGLNLVGSMPDDIMKVAESGIDADTLPAFAAAGFGAFLVGESLMRETDIGAATKHLLGCL